MLGVNPGLLPIKMALTVSGGRIGIAIPLVVELLLMEFIVEIFRDGSLRLPTVSQTLGVASGVILGFAAVNAGIVSNANLVVSIITAIASYSGPNYDIGLSWRVLRFVLIFYSGDLWALWFNHRWVNHPDPCRDPKLIRHFLPLAVGPALTQGTYRCCSAAAAVIKTALKDLSTPR